MSTDRPPQPPPAGPPPVRRTGGRRFGPLIGVALLSALVVVAIAALLVTIFHRREEARHPYLMFVEVDEGTTNPAVWGVNWPRQYQSYLRTTDSERTRYGGSDAIPTQKLDKDPWLRAMWSGYAFSLDYRESRGHAYTLHDQDHTLRVLERPQPGACLHCHASVIPAYREIGEGDVFEGFARVSAMPWQEARHLTDGQGKPLIEHPLSCVDCHSPRTMELRITRPAFITGIAELQRHQGVEDYDVNRDATRQEMRSYVCAQCHVEYYFRPGDNLVVYPWANGLRVEQIEEYYDERDFADWRHGITGARALKAQHPEFELWSQGIHARAGVACADCHMPYRREGAMKVSDHHVRSPMLNVGRACQPCHNVAAEELEQRVHTIQDRTQGLIDRGAAALVGAIEAIATVQAQGDDPEGLERALQLQRSAQWRLDFVYSEGSHGFHAPQESARILAEVIDYARQAEAAAYAAFTPTTDLEAIAAPPVEGVTPDEEAPPGRIEAPEARASPPPSP